VAAAALAGCAGPAQRPDSAPSAGLPAPAAGTYTGLADPVRTQIVFTAMQMVGVPYVWGGAAPTGFDCSGLVHYAYANAGIPVPRTAADQLGATAPLTLEQAEAGDLLFFRDGGRTSHVAIYLGQGRFVHAPNGGKQVSLDSFANTYWRARFARAGRIAPKS